MLNDRALKELFARSDKNASGILEFPEFDKALDALEEQLGKGTLHSLGLSTSKIIMAIAW